MGSERQVTAGSGPQRNLSLPRGLRGGTAGAQHCQGRPQARPNPARSWARSPGRRPGSSGRSAPLRKRSELPAFSVITPLANTHRSLTFTAAARGPMPSTVHSRFSAPRPWGPDLRLLVPRSTRLRPRAPAAAEPAHSPRGAQHIQSNRFVFRAEAQKQAQGVSDSPRGTAAWRGRSGALCPRGGLPAHLGGAAQRKETAGWARTGSPGGRLSVQAGSEREREGAHGAHAGSPSQHLPRLLTAYSR